MGQEPRWKVFLRDWMLPIAIVLGIAVASVYHAVPALHRYGHIGKVIVSDGQRWVIAVLLFCQFVKISPHDLRLRRWHVYILLFQIFCFVGLALLARGLQPGGVRILVECAMLCLICPTASAAGVITERLGGQLAGTVTYLVIINLVGTLLIPSIIPMVQPSAELGFWAYVLRIAGKIFPVLIVPAMLAWLIRYTWSRLQRILMRIASYSFYVWGIGLTFAMILSTHSLIQSGLGGAMITGIVVVSASCCLIQFLFGRYVGSLTAGQTLGQKNTGFLIWLGYTYLTPVTAVAGGLYAIWQNIFNAWELYDARRRGTTATSSPSAPPGAHERSRGSVRRHRT